jgi:hypothetical protein
LRVGKGDLEDVIGLLYEQKRIVEKMRRDYYSVLNSNKPDKFKVRVTDSQKYSANLSGEYSSTDLIN